MTFIEIFVGIPIALTLLRILIPIIFGESSVLFFGIMGINVFASFLIAISTDIPFIKSFEVGAVIAFIAYIALRIFNYMHGYKERYGLGALSETSNSFAGEASVYKQDRITGNIDIFGRKQDTYQALVNVKDDTNGARMIWVPIRAANQADARSIAVGTYGQSAVQGVINS